MNKLSKEKRNQLILTSAGILLLLGGIYFTLIQYQQTGLKPGESKSRHGKKAIRDSRQHQKQPADRE